MPTRTIVRVPATGSWKVGTGWKFVAGQPAKEGHESTMETTEISEDQWR